MRNVIARQRPAGCPKRPLVILAVGSPEDPDFEIRGTRGLVDPVKIKMHRGDPKAGYNGVTPESLMLLLKHCLARQPYNHDTSLAASYVLHHLTEALFWQLQCSDQILQLGSDA